MVIIILIVVWWGGGERDGKDQIGGKMLEFKRFNFVVFFKRQFFYCIFKEFVVIGR